MILKLRPDTDHPLYVVWSHVVKVSDSKLLLSTGNEVDLEPGEAAGIIKAVEDDELIRSVFPLPKGKRGR